MKLVINGETKDVPSTVSTVSDLLAWLQLKADRVAVELNREISPRGRWTEVQLAEHDRLEIVQFVGGGCLHACV